MIFERLRRLENRSERLESAVSENTRMTRDVVRQTEAIAGQMHDLSLNGERAAIKQIADHLPSVVKLAERADAIVTAADTMASIRKALWYLVGATVTAILGAGAYWGVVVVVAHH